LEKQKLWTVSFKYSWTAWESTWQRELVKDKCNCGLSSTWKQQSI